MTKRESLTPAQRLRDFLPPKYMTSIAAEPTKPAEAAMLHSSLDLLVGVLREVRPYLADPDFDPDDEWLAERVRWIDKAIGEPDV